MGSGSSQLQSEHPYFQSTRSLHSNTHPTPVGRPADNKSSIIKLEKTKKDILAKEEKHIQEHNGFTPFTPRGTIGYSSNPKHPSKQGSKSGTKKKGKRSSGVSFHARNVYISDEDDGEFDDEELDSKRGWIVGWYCGVCRVCWGENGKFPPSPLSLSL